jgi:hypothetical protein
MSVKYKHQNMLACLHGDGVEDSMYRMHWTAILRNKLCRVCSDFLPHSHLRRLADDIVVDDPHGGGKMGCIIRVGGYDATLSLRWEGCGWGGSEMRAEVAGRLGQR